MYVMKKTDYNIEQFGWNVTTLANVNVELSKIALRITVLTRSADFTWKLEVLDETLSEFDIPEDTFEQLISALEAEGASTNLQAQQILGDWFIVPNFWQFALQVNGCFYLQAQLTVPPVAYILGFDFYRYKADNSYIERELKPGTVEKIYELKPTGIFVA